MKQKKVKYSFLVDLQRTTIRAVDAEATVPANQAAAKSNVNAEAAATVNKTW